MTIPQHLSYSPDHEWVLLDGDLATVGITAFAAASLGDVVFAGLPVVGVHVTAGEACGELESTKSVSDIMSPVSGEVIEVNGAVTANPGVVNDSPFDAGWLFKARVDDAADLLDAGQYARLCGEEPR